MLALAGKRVWVAGHGGMVGGALARRLAPTGCEVLTIGRERLDLRRQAEVEAYLAAARPDVVVLAAARVGGILANATRPADFLLDNLQIETNVLAAAAQQGVEKLLLLGSSCLYPRLAPQPIPETALLTGPLEPSNEAYAIAKLAGIKLGQALRRQHGLDVIAAMPCNLYGPGDNYDPESSHVLAALVRKAHEAKLAGSDSLTLWGSGRPLREFLHVKDCAEALVFLLEHYSAEEIVNVGSGEEVSILDLARLVCAVVGFEGEIVHDPSKPDGTPRKLMDSSRLRALGWRPRIGLAEGIEATYAAFLRELG